MYNRTDPTTVTHVDSVTGCAQPKPVSTGGESPHLAARSALDDRAEVRVYETEADPTSGQYPEQRDLALYRGSSSRELESFVLYVDVSGNVDSRFAGQSLPGGAVIVEVHRWRWSRWEVDVIHRPHGLDPRAIEAVAEETRREAAAFA